ncbi:MAG: LL-diaminopimelate aminotransferase [Omnitrophica WOR_2 bacterium RIFCSPLOWO2_12_FULL_51_24]|nr:MAG: LL-diaminopimelate aminotransferase [Omnitrophica WOR_2 bacterium RIFCSPHIGHO2_01_FULL_49_10]OGX33898.1 MAG: LL-diaminopimelate aminotransferase [Omnitrophica WOR_2 bacterium RIFCSPLOWO2_02_FULL_50_19]OGX43811.1 MAG: LL-diaminopimelate aminotransferase [Omnitrophica WOR_2 bacterium RIFCSPLOWO2_12_FULL_51_24]
MTDFELSERLAKLPPYLFAEIDKAKRQAKAEGRDIVDLGIGDPDLPTPKHIINALYKAALDPANHHYALDSGMPRLRQAIAKWYKKRFKVHLDPDTEVLPLIGSKEGIAHIPLAFVNQGDYVLVPDPCYPPYKNGTIFAGGVPYLMPLLAENGFLPDLGKIKSGVANKAKMIFINYPNNPTGAVADEEFYKRVLDFAHRNNILVCSDAAYSEVRYDRYRPMSILEMVGAKDRTIEFHSLSKSYNMTGWRIGWACGNKKAIQGLAKVKSNIDSGIFQAIQLAGIAALEGSQGSVEKANRIYKGRRDALVNGLSSLGWRVSKPKATFYVWAKVLSGYNSASMAKALLERADIIATPGSGFGKYGEGYIRMALTVPKDRIKTAVQRIKRSLPRHG